MKYEILKKEALTIAELGELTKNIKKKDLAPVHQKIGDYSTKFSKLNKDKSAKLKQDISKIEIPRLDDEHITAIINLMPEDMNELKTVFAGSKTTITQENLDKLMDVLKQYGK